MVDFDHYAIHQCYLLMDDLLRKKIDCIEFANRFIEMFNLIDEDYGFDILNDVPELCTSLIREEIDFENFRDKLKPYFSRLKKTFNY